MAKEISRLVLRVTCILCIGALLSVPAGAQSQTGTPSFISTMNFGPASVNLGNLNVHLSANLYNKPGRGIPFDYSLAYDTLAATDALRAGWMRTGPAGFVVDLGVSSNLCYLTETYFNEHGYGRFFDAAGTVRLSGMIAGPVGDPCANPPGTIAPLGDGSGWSYTVDSNLNVNFILPDGTTIMPLHVSFPGSSEMGSTVGGGTLLDTNGNLLYQEITPNPNQVVDTTDTPFAVGGDYWQIKSLGYTDSNGNAQTVKVSYNSPVGYIQTNFGCSGGRFDFPATLIASTLVTQISYPDGSSEQFSYEPTPGSTTATTGRISQITLRTGGTINFAYTGPNDGINCTDGTMAGLTVTTSDGTTTFQRVLGTAAGSATTTVTDPQQNQLVVSFLNGFEVQRQIYQGSSSGGTLLETIVTCYNGNKSNCTTTSPKLPLRELTVFNELPNGQQNEQDTFFDTNSELQTEIDEYDFGSGGPGSLLRKTMISYANLGNGILNRPASVTICSGTGSDSACNNAGTKIAQSTFGYDESSLGTSNAQMHQAVTGARGNLTSVHRWLNTNGGTVNTTYTFDDAGQILSATDGNLNVTSFGYACNDAYMGTTTRPATSSQHVTSMTYDCNTGLVQSVKDENTNSTTFSYDEIRRPTQTNFADGGQTTFSYPTSNQAIVQSKIDSSRSTYSTSLSDGYGRISRTALANGEAVPYDQQDFCYNAEGQLGFKSYLYQASAPVFGTAKVCSGAGDSFTYDALGRTTQVTHSDGSSTSTSFSGRAVQVSDEGNGSSTVSRILQRDGLGRIQYVCQLYSGSPLMGSGGTPASCGLDIAGTGFLTTYGYNLLDNLTSVSQGSLNARSFQYDSLSRETNAATPEAGASTYVYDANSNLVSRTDARSITTTYFYDVLNRLTQKSYSDGVTPAANFVYDTAPAWTNPAATTSNVIGRLGEIYTGPSNAAAIFGYDTMGRVIMNNQCTPIDCGSGNRAVNYTYDLLGDMTSSSNGVGVTFGYSYNIAGRLNGMTSSLNDATHPPTLLSAVQYSPSVITDTLGNGVVETTDFSQRGMLTSYLGNSPNGTPGTGTVTISGTLQTYQQQTQPGTPATLTVTIGGSDGTDSTQVCVPNGRGGETCTTEHGKDGGNITFTVTAPGGASVSTAAVPYNSSSTTGSLAQGLYNALPSNSIVTMSNPNNGPTFTLTTVAADSAANGTTFAATVASSCKPPCSGPIGGWTVTPSSGNFAGGTNATYQTAYDNGTTTISVNSHPDSYSWSGSGTTAASIAQGVCNAINGDTAAFATANTNGIAGECPLGSATVSLASRNDGQNYTLTASSSSVVNSFSVGCPGFSNCLSATLTGGGSPAYSFTLGEAPNGQITSANDLVNGNWTYGYDPLNRLLSSNKNSGQQSFSYVYDAYGNRWEQNSSGYVFDNNNHITTNGVTYDAAGNVLADGLGNSFSWDAEGRLIQVKQGSTIIASYVYGADGSRVEGPNGDYLYDLAGHMITQFGLNGVWNFGEIYARGRHLATYSGGTTNFFHSDWLGTRRVMTALNGTISETCTSLPFGDGVNCTGANLTYNGFTDFIHDPETNLEHSLFRQYSSTQGRWLTPDPYAGSASVADPQSWNRYAYVENNATNAIDPLGLYCPTYRVAGIVCMPGNFGNGFQADSWDNMPFPGGFDISVDFGSIPSPAAVNCFIAGACPNIPFLSLGQQLQALLAGLPWNNPCIMSPISDGCGFNSLQDPYGPFVAPPSLFYSDDPCVAEAQINATISSFNNANYYAQNVANATVDGLKYGAGVGCVAGAMVGAGYLDSKHLEDLKNIGAVAGCIGGGVILGAEGAAIGLIGSSGASLPFFLHDQWSIYRNLQSAKNACIVKNATGLDRL